MKKLSFLFAMLFLSGMVFLTSCSDDDEDGTDPILKPTITFLGGANYVDEDTTLNKGDQYLVGISAQQNQESGEKIQQLTLKIENSQGVLFEFNEEYNDESIPQYVDTLTVLSDEGMVETVTFTVTDKDFQSASVSFDITVATTPSPIITYTDIELGALNSDLGSTFASVNGNVYNLAGGDAANHSEEIDLVYFYNDQQNAALAAPTDPDVQGEYPSITTWATINNTKFKETTLTASDFDGINDANTIVIAAQNANNTISNYLSVNQVIAFITDSDKPDFAGKSGLIKITALNPENDGDIKFDVKIEE